MYIFEFDVEPQAVQSVRAFAVQKKQKKGAKIFFHQDPKKKAFKENIAFLAKKQIVEKYPDFKILDSHLEVQVIHVFPPIKSLSKIEFSMIENGILIAKKTTPDVSDNLNKGLFDALSDIIWANDSRISFCDAKKFYGKQEKIILFVKPLESIYYKIIGNQIISC